MPADSTPASELDEAPSDPPQGEPADDPSSEADAEAREPPPKLPRVFRLWMLWAFLGALATGAGAGALYWQYHLEHERDPPALNLCFRVLQKRLAKPAIVAPSEPYTFDDGETVYLSDTQQKTLGCVARLPGRADVPLVRAWTIEDPEAQARALAEMVEAVPPHPDYDKTALGLWRLAHGTLEALPESGARVEAERRIDQVAGCRFSHPRLPPCPTRPPIPSLVWILGGASALLLLATLAGFGKNLVANVRTRLALRRAR